MRSGRGSRQKKVHSQRDCAGANGKDENDTTYQTKWWDMIRSGEKKEEYRDITPYYAKRFATALGMYHRQLNPKRMEETDARVPIHNIVLRAGYSLDSPTMMVGGMLRVGQGRTEWGAVPGVKYFIIEIDYIEVLCTDDWERAGCPKLPNN